jgi:tetratricopeptide (TPR) repeat protein
MLRRVTRLIGVLFIVVTLVGCAYGKAMKRGDEAFEQENWESALTHYEKALEVDPESTEAKEKIRATKEEMVGEYSGEARAALENGDLLGAMVAAKKAYEKLPEASATKDVIQEVSNATFAKGQELAGQKDYANALMLYESLGKTLPTEKEKAQPRAAEVKETWVTALESGAETAEEAGRLGDAMLHWAKITQLTGDPTHGGKRDALRKQILDEWAYHVRITGRKNKAYESVVAGLKNAGAGTALNVVDKAPSGVDLDAKTSLRMGRARFSTDRSTRTESARYQSGTKQVPNPFYKSKQDDVLREEKRLVEYENDVTDLENDVARYQEQVAKEGPSEGVSTGAEQNLSRAQSSLESARRKVQDQRNRVQRAKEELAREPQTKEEPVYSQHEYTVTTHTLTGTLKYQAKITHEDGREALTSSDAISVSASDDAHPAQQIANVAEDPLQLPSKAELTGQLHQKALQRTEALVADSFNRWRASLVEKAMAAGSDDERVDLLTIYIVTNPADVTAKVPADISAMRGIPDAVKVLSP